MSQLFLVNSNKGEYQMCNHLLPNAPQQNFVPVSNQYVPPPEDETAEQQLQRLGLLLGPSYPSATPDIETPAHALNRIDNASKLPESEHLVPPQVRW